MRGFPAAFLLVQFFSIALGMANPKGRKAGLREKLDTSHALYREPLQRAFRWLDRKGQPGADARPPNTLGLHLAHGIYLSLIHI